VSETEQPGSDAGQGAPEREGELRALNQALEELRAEIHSRFVARRESIDWMALFDDLRRRFGSVGMIERSGEVDEFGLDEVALSRLQPVLDFLERRWWRVDVAGLEGVPPGVPCLIAGNRSGLLPYDGLMLSNVLARANPDGPRPRFLVADWLITLPFAQPFLTRIGGVRASRENAERLLRSGRSVIAFPEGLKGAAKVYRERYRLQRFGRGGVIRLALETRCPLVPVAVVGAEEVHPILFKVETLPRAAGLPFLPVTPTFPLLGPLGVLPLPSKWSLRFGEPLPLDSLGPEAAQDELLVARVNEELRARIQAMVDRAVEERSSVWA
jgi:1-acyl-sn-glycerol-3-phosphate acyltransferase